MEDPEKIKQIGNIEKFKNFKQCKCSQRLLAPEEKSEDSDDNVWAADGIINNIANLDYCLSVRGKKQLKSLLGPTRLYWVLPGHSGTYLTLGFWVHLGSLMQAGMQTSQM